MSHNLSDSSISRHHREGRGIFLTRSKLTQSNFIYLEITYTMKDAFCLFFVFFTILINVGEFLYCQILDKSRMQIHLSSVCFLDKEVFFFIKTSIELGVSCFLLSHIPQLNDR